jgi:hypothetical protein
MYSLIVTDFRFISNRGGAGDFGESLGQFGGASEADLGVMSIARIDDLVREHGGLSSLAYGRRLT